VCAAINDAPLSEKGDTPLIGLRRPSLPGTLSFLNAAPPEARTSNAHLKPDAER
jgi:hypothetical protein